MRVMITGSKGQLGLDILKVIGHTEETFSFDREQLNVADAEAVTASVKDIAPEVIVHTAAYTKVDEAENDPDTAFRVNTVGTCNMAVAASECGAKLIYISTDYVFDGLKGSPYNEYDKPNPINVYGKSKYYGELLVQSLHNRYFILRTSWLYGNHGNHFVRKIVTAAKLGRTLEVVNDEIGSPTYTLDLACFIHRLMTTNRYGIYHASNKGYCSRYEFALAIVQEAGMSTSLINPISGNSFLRPACRPKYSAFDLQAIRLNGLEELPLWREALARYMQSESALISE